MKLSDLLPERCFYCNKRVVYMDVHLRCCKVFNEEAEKLNEKTSCCIKIIKKLDEEDK